MESLRKLGGEVTAVLIDYNLDAEEWLLEQENNCNLEIHSETNAVMKINIEGVSCLCLIDSGSSRSCISQDLFQKLLTKNKNIAEIPTIGTQIISAVGTKSKRIRRQVLLKIQINGKQEEFIFLVVPGLIYNVIFGKDWLNQTKCNLNYQEQFVEFFWEDVRIKISLSNNVNEDSKELATCTVEYFCDVDSRHEVTEPTATRSINYEEEEEEEDEDYFREIIDKLIEDTNLSDEYLYKLRDVLETCKRIYRKKLGRTNIYEHSFNILDYSEFIGIRYPVPLSKIKAVDAAVEKMLHDGIIERSNSNFLNPLVIVDKKDNTVRLCLDARILNKRVEADYERPQLIEELLQNFHGKKWFSSIDLKSSFWQVPLREEDRKFTAFSHRGQVFQFTRVPFGVRSSSAALIRAVNLALRPTEETRDFVTCYVDDLVVASRTLDEHMEHLKIVLSKLADAGFTIKAEKSKFCVKEFNFLGHTVGIEGVRPDSQSLKRIMNINTPRNLKQLRSFFGVTNYFRRAIPNYAYFMEDLRDLLRHDVKWKWERKHDLAFQQMKQQFANPITLAFPDEELPYFVITDASDKGISGLLYQEEEGEKRVISLASRSLAKAEKNFTTTEKELLAIIYSLQKFRRYLLGTHFTIKTDHSALTFVKSCKLTSTRISRWILYLQIFDFDIVHVAGRDNLVADFFSRNPEEESKVDIVSNEEEIYICIIRTAEAEKRELFVNMGNKQDEEPGLNVIKQKIKETGELDFIYQEEGSKSQFRIQNNLLQTKSRDDVWKVIVPVELQENLTLFYHAELGHYAAGKVLAAIQENFIWRNMGRKVRQILARCEVCQKAKHPVRYLEGPHQNVLRNKPGELVSIDLFGPLVKSKYGMQYVFVMLDVFSKLVRLYPIRKATSKACWGKVENYCQELGQPGQLLSDHGTQFTSRSWRRNMEDKGIKQLYSSIRYPQGNQVERVMKELSRAIRTYCHDNHRSWYDWIGRIETWMNVVTHESTGKTASEIHFGQKPTRKIAEWLNLNTGEVIDRNIAIHLAREQLLIQGSKRKRRREHKKTTELEIGTLVLLRVNRTSSMIDKVAAKMFLLYEGPYVISQRYGKCAYQLSSRDGTLIGIYNVHNLKKFME